MRRGFIALLAIGVLGAAVALFPTSADAACFGRRDQVFWCENDWFLSNAARPNEARKTVTPSTSKSTTLKATATTTSTRVATSTSTSTPAPARAARPAASPTAAPASTPASTPAATATPRPAPSPTATASPAATPTSTPAPTGTPSAPTTVSSGKVLQSFGITRNGQTLTIPVYSSLALSKTDTRIQRAVLVVHGTNRNATDYFDYADAAVPSDVLVVAPRFQTSSDSPQGTELYWTNSAWKEGADSTGSRPWRLSTFEVTDELLRSLHVMFPNLATVVVAGHSAGGQFVQRYAATNTDGRHHFVVANPSSYLYMSADRPESTGGCSSFNHYKYGLEDLGEAPYVSAIGASALKARYGASQVTYLLGADDTDPNAADLDTTCEAETQGANRRERGQAFYDRLDDVYGSGIYARHTLRIVSGVDHSAREMFGAASGRAALAD